MAPARISGGQITRTTQARAEDGQQGGEAAQRPADGPRPSDALHHRRGGYRTPRGGSGWAPPVAGQHLGDDLLDAGDGVGAGAVLAEALDERDGLDPSGDAVEAPRRRRPRPARRRRPPAPTTPPTTLPSKLCASRKPSPVTTRSAPSMRSSRSSSSATRSKPGTRRAPAAARPPASPPAAPAPSEGGDVDAVLGEVHLGQPLEPTAEQLHLGRGRPLLRSEDLGRVDEAGPDVAGHDELDALQAAQRVERPEGGQPAVGGGRPADADDDPPRTGLERRCDQLAGAGGGGGHRVVALGAPGHEEAGRLAPSRSPRSGRPSRHRASTGRRAGR